jgi:hypothetical protein
MALAIIGAILLLIVVAASALASGPASVTVRIEGLAETRLAATQVNTTATPVVKDGKPSDACPGTNAAGALELATGGNWSGQWFGGGVTEGKFKGLGYSVETILGESYPFVSGSFWDFWVNNTAQEEGVCDTEMHPGDQVLLYPCHFEEGKECPNPLAIEAPTIAGTGEPVSVAVKKYAAAGTAMPAPGVSVVGASSPVITDVAGHAALTFLQAGEVTLHATGSNVVRTATTICVHNGNDGTCGTPAPAAAGRSTGNTQNVPVLPYRGPYAIVARTTGLLDTHSYTRRNVPRLLGGIVTAHTTVTAVSIELWRWHKGRCYTYDGRQERFLSAPCARAGYFKIPSASRFFKVSSTSSFSYLLPFALGPGEYVLDVQAVDAAGNRTTLARGTSRIRFYVH